MALLGTMEWNHLKIRRLRSKRAPGVLVLPLIGVTLLLSGCNTAGFDFEQLKLGGDSHVIIDPATIAYDFDDSKQNPYSGEETTAPDWGITAPVTPPRVPAGQTSNRNPVTTPEQFAALEHTVIFCTDYNKYLREHVYNPVSEIINKLPQSQRDKIYFRLVNAGYNLASSGDEITKGTPLTLTKQGNKVNNLGGQALPSFVFQWLREVNSNDSGVERARSETLAVISNLENLGVDTKSDWLLSSEDKSIPSSIKAMWGCERLGCSTLYDYKMSVLNSSGFNAIPDLRLSVRTGPSSTSGVTINPTSGTNSGLRYKDSMRLSDANTIFTSYNQYPTRYAALKESRTYDENSILMGYADGYCKTLIYLGTNADDNLQELLGDSYGEVLSIISGAYDVSEWQSIVSLYPEAKVIPAGLRGAN